MRQVAPELAQWLSQFNSQLEELIKAGYERTPLTARNGLATLTATFVTTKPEVSQIIDDTLSVQQTYSIHGQTTTPANSIPVRIYRPAADHPMPVMLYLHGGGHMAGNIESTTLFAEKLPTKPNILSFLLITV
ncbi:hypothetical protein [Veronia nyctiphanis]|uniref:hypothetical protein n=1 Tax=Veronia nyctiphanis TaxID=1278244 RepID=UPI001F3F4C18|nr:hypothetical protein [Veronia nyctiphanis]